MHEVVKYKEVHMIFGNIQVYEAKIYEIEKHFFFLKKASHKNILELSHQPQRLQNNSDEVKEPS